MTGVILHRASRPVRQGGVQIEDVPEFSLLLEQDLFDQSGCGVAIDVC